MGIIITMAILAMFAIVAFVVRRVFTPKTDVKAQERYKEELAKWQKQYESRTYFNEPKPQDPSKSDSQRSFIARIAGWVGMAFIGFLVLGVAFNSYTIVPTKEIGVVTTFGAPTGSLPNGWHLKAPWQDVTLMDGAVQTDTHNRPADKPFNEGCVQVRIAHQIVACANMYVKWQTPERSVDGLFQNYRTFDNIRDALVTKNVQSVLNKVFATYDPLSIDPKTGLSDAPELSVLSKQALADLRTAVGDKIDVMELSVTVMNYDDPTQSKINGLQGQVAQTRIAQQSIETAKKQAEANRELAASVSKDPNVLVSRCLDMVAEGKNNLPAGFSCWPGAGSAVVVPSAPAAK